MARGFQGAVLRGFGARDHTATVLETVRIAPHFVRIRMESPTLFQDAAAEPAAWLRFWLPDPEGSSTEFQIISGELETRLVSFSSVVFVMPVSFHWLAPTYLAVSNGATGRSAGNRGSGPAGLKVVFSGCGKVIYGLPSLSTCWMVAPAWSMPFAPGKFGYRLSKLQFSW